MDATHRYEQLAQLFIRRIDKGVLAPGARKTSLRTISEQHGISTSTALQTYQDCGILIARPQAGFYIAAPHACAPGAQSTGNAAEDDHFAL